MTPKYKLIKVKDGQVLKTKRYGNLAIQGIVCCDCHLTHWIILTIAKKHVEMRVWRDDEITNEIRQKGLISELELVNKAWSKSYECFDEEMSSRRT